MSKAGFSYGLNLGKKSSAKPLPAKRKPIFGGDPDSDNDEPSKQNVSIQEIGGLDAFDLPTSASKKSSSVAPTKSKSRQAAAPTHPPSLKSKSLPRIELGDLSSALTSRKNAEAAQAEDETVYDYDGVYDSMKSKKKGQGAGDEEEGGESRPRYMAGLMAAAAVRKRDALIAEEKKIARDREAEGEEFAGKEKFVTAAYKKQLEENRLLQEAEKRREEEEERKSGGSGMTAFYKNLLVQGDRQHAEVVKAAAVASKTRNPDQDAEEKKERTDADVAKELNEKGASIIINEDGEVVDKRQLLRGGLNVVAKKRDTTVKNTDNKSRNAAPTDRGNGKGFVGAGGRRAMIARQSRMLEEQLEQQLKRSREAEEDEARQAVERASKTRKTESDISSAKERYLARKREAEEAKKKEIAK